MANRDKFCYPGTRINESMTSRRLRQYQAQSQGCGGGGGRLRPPRNYLGPYCILAYPAPCKYLYPRICLAPPLPFLVTDLDEMHIAHSWESVKNMSLCKICDLLILWRHARIQLLLCAYYVPPTWRKLWLISYFTALKFMKAVRLTELPSPY